ACTGGRALREWKMFSPDLAVARQDVGALDQIAQLAQVARETVLLQVVDGLRTDAARGLVQICRNVPRENLAENRDVVSALTQGRKGNGHNREAIIKVFAKQSVLDPLLQVAVSRHQHPHVNCTRLRRSHPNQLSISKDTQQLGLCG